MLSATRAALTARPLFVASVPDAFGRRGGCYVRGYTDAELELMIHAASSGGKLDAQRLRQVQLAAVLLSGPAPDSPRLLGPEPQPTREQVAMVAKFPPQSLDRLVQISDNLVGLTVELQLALRQGETFLGDDPADAESPNAAIPEPLRVVDLGALAAEPLGCEPAEDVFGSLGGIYVREYDTAEAARWELLGQRGRHRSPRRVRWAKLAACLMLGPEPDSPRLIGDGQAVTAEDLAWVSRYVWPGEQLRLGRMADVLSGWSADTEARLATAEVPLPGASSATGASTG